MATKKEQKEQERAEAIKELRKLLRPGSKVYTILRSVSASGMTRRIDLYTIQMTGKPFGTSRGEMAFLTDYAAKVLGYRHDYKWGGLVVGGCGMDMGWHVVHSLGCVLFPKGFIPAKAGGRGRNGSPDTERDTDGGYALNQSWL